MDKEIFDRGIALQMAQTQEEALEILRTDPLLTEEEAQKMAALWPENGGALKMKRKNSGDPHLKIAGIIPATDEERLELMQTLLNFSAEESKELLDKMNARRKK